MSEASNNSSWIRKKDAEQGKATFPELFYDLVFVFALIQLSQTLASDFSSTAVIEAALLILAVWWVWIHSTWLTNLLDTEKEPVRLMLFALMFCGILLAIALPDAFGEQGLAFAVIYSTMQIGRSLFALYAMKGEDQQSFLTFLRITIWLVASSLFWIAGGLVEIEARLLLWSVALALEYISPALHYYVPGLGRSPAETLDISGEHMAERCALFVIICLGETILTTGKNASEHMEGGLTFVVLCGAFLSTVIMWWIYFHRGQEEAADEVEESGEPEKVAHTLFTYGHLPIVAGIILTAVGEDFALSHPQEQSTLAYGMAILGGPILFVAGTIWVKWVTTNRIPLSHVVGIGLLTAASLLVASQPNYIVHLIVAPLLFTVAAWEYLAVKRREPVIDDVDDGSTSG